MSALDLWAIAIATLSLAVSVWTIVRQQQFDRWNTEQQEARRER